MCVSCVSDQIKPANSVRSVCSIKQVPLHISEMETKLTQQRFNPRKMAWITLDGVLITGPSSPMAILPHTKSEKAKQQHTIR